MPPDPPHPFVSRGGLKLRHALDRFQLDVSGLRCADFGANIGGFTDCLLQAGAAHITALDTGYGTLAWKLRNDPRVTVLERTNALHAPTPAPDALVDLVVIDMGWTPQRLCIPAAMKWLRPPPSETPHSTLRIPHSCIISLIKPHYELADPEKPLLVRGVLPDADSERIATRTLDSLPALGVRILGSVKSPILGGASRGRAGNSEWLALLAPSS